MAGFLSLHDAVARYVQDGATVTMEGFTHLIPFAAGHEVIRQKKRDLTLIRMTPDIIYDQMIGAGCAKKVIFSWGGNPGVGSLHRLRDAVEKAGRAKSRFLSIATQPWPLKRVLRGYHWLFSWLHRQRTAQCQRSNQIH